MLFLLKDGVPCIAQYIHLSANPAAAPTHISLDGKVPSMPSTAASDPTPPPTPVPTPTPTPSPTAAAGGGAGICQGTGAAAGYLVVLGAASANAADAGCASRGLSLAAVTNTNTGDVVRALMQCVGLGNYESGTGHRVWVQSSPNIGPGCSFYWARATAVSRSTGATLRTGGKGGNDCAQTLPTLCS